MRRIENPLAGMLRISPPLFCRDPGRALAWLERVFGGTTDFLLREAKIPVLLRHV